jgi:hypothetical protein
MKNAICPVYRDTQLPPSSNRSLSLFLFGNQHHHLINPDASANLVFVKHDSLRPLKITAANKGGTVYCLLQPDNFSIDPKVYGSKFIPTYQILLHPDCSCCRDKVNRLQADAQLSLFLQSHLDNFIMT